MKKCGASINLSLSLLAPRSAFSMHGAPTYIAEMAPPSLRGLLVSLKEAFIVVGILFGFLLGYLLCSDESSYMVEGGWKWSYGSR